jgi:hypothetical protein
LAVLAQPLGGNLPSLSSCASIDFGQDPLDWAISTFPFAAAFSVGLGPLANSHWPHNPCRRGRGFFPSPPPLSLLHKCKVGNGGNLGQMELNDAGGAHSINFLLIKWRGGPKTLAL